MLKAIFRTVMWQLFGKVAGRKNLRTARQVQRATRMARRMRR